MEWLLYGLTLLAAPLVPGWINKVKAAMAGRRGPPLLQLYRDVWKLARKETVETTELSVVGRWAPVVLAATGVVALAVLPIGNRSVIAFPGDFIALVYVLVLGRLLLVLAALDTGSSFQGMGASRELLIAALAEPAFLLGLTVLVIGTHELTLSGIFTNSLPYVDTAAIPALILAGVVFLLVALAENARIPFDDPNTHLELTMIHEVMVLDYSGVQLALVLYGGALKLVLFCGLLGRLILPLPVGGDAANAASAALGILLVATLIGLVESLTARIRMMRISHMLGTATAFAVLALLLTLS
ncbi:MAG TPA: NADH-quinone oxidoreductase subunit H [Longimicrobiales bacterium]|nr:NADH-quinone oxidoreductase subunit H [Longimicrobiales bacterium]